MKIQLTHRHYGVHAARKEADIPGVLTDYATLKPADGGPYDGREYVIDEDKLLAALPAGFLPVPAKHVLIGIDDTAQSGVTKFHDWAKYFDAYMLWLRTPESLKQEAAS